MDIRLTRIAFPVFGLVFLFIVVAGTVDRTKDPQSFVETSVAMDDASEALSSVLADESPETLTEMLIPLEGIPAVSTSVRMLIVGDIMMDRNVAKRMKDAKDPSYPFRKLPERWFESYDYAVANLEGPVTDKRRPPEKSIDFLFDPTVIPVLKEQGIDAFSQANNHALDQGTAGYIDSVARLREAGFLIFGHQVRDDEVALATTTIKGRRFAFLGFNTTDNPLDRISAQRVIALARAEADEVIALVHWGQEYRHVPDPSTVELAHWLIDQDVDVVIGGHPHWVQGIERYKGRPIVYSLGNFIFDQDFSEKTTQGLAVELTFNDKGIVLVPIPLKILKSQPMLTDRFGMNEMASYSSTLSHDDHDGQSHAEFLREIVSGQIFFPHVLPQ